MSLRCLGFLWPCAAWVGSVVSTRHGNVSTEHILFICSGAFHSVKPSDMLAELQGRLPIRVELRALEQRVSMGLGPTHLCPPLLARAACWGGSV